MPVAKEVWESQKSNRAQKGQHEDSAGRNVLCHCQYPCCDIIL